MGPSIEHISTVHKSPMVQTSRKRENCLTQLWGRHSVQCSDLSDSHWDPSGFGLIFMESGESHFAFCCLFLSLTDSDSGRCPVVSSPLLARSYYCNKHQPFFPLNNPSRCTTLPFMNKSPRSPPGQAATHFYLWTQQGREPSQSEIQV